MKDLNNNMDKVFRDKLEDFQQQPPEEIWDGIKAGLGKKPRRKILIPLWQVAAGMALIITAGGTFYFLNSSPKDQLAEQFLVIPNNVLIPEETTKSNPSKSDPYITTEKKSNKEIPVKSKNSGTAEAKVLNTPYTKKEQNIIAQTVSETKSLGEKSDTKISDQYSAMVIPGAYLQPAHKDQIPRNKIKPVASWDMLTADLDVTEENMEDNERLLLTAQVSPTYSYRDIGTIGAQSQEQYNQFESGKISYSGGLQFGYKTSERFSIHAGIMYAQLGYNIENVERFNDYASVNNTDIVSVPEGKSNVYSVKNSIGTISATSPENGYFVAGNGVQSQDKANFDNVFSSGSNADFESGAKIEQYFQYLEVPFLMRYKIIDKKMGVNILGGVSTNILVGNHASLTSGEETSKIGNSQNIRNVNYMGSMGLGFDYNLRRNLIFTIEPQFKYFLNSINQAQLISNRPYMLGMFTGVRYMW